MTGSRSTCPLFPQYLGISKNNSDCIEIKPQNNSELFNVCGVSKNLPEIEQRFNTVR